LPELQAEYDYWMQGENEVRSGGAVRHVVRLLDGSVLNRYWDERAAPRDESYKEDVQTAMQSDRPAGEVWRDLRAAAESGWDFSSRWLADGKTLTSIRTLALLPPDLNSLLVRLEQTLAGAYLLSGDAQHAELYAKRAADRIEAIRRVMWDAEDGVFTDYLWRQGQTTRAVTAATLFPLFLNVGAPLQWVAVVGLRNYGFDAAAQEIATRWVAKTIAGYQQEAKLVEKYDVMTTGGDEGRGGEYATQIGFGWTNGVLLALGSLYPALKAAAEAATPAPQVALAQ
jgi:alpha,alpha-trehalase